MTFSKKQPMGGRRFNGQRDGLTQMLDRAGARELLTHEQEVELSARIQAGLAAASELESAGDISAAHRMELRRLVADGQEARNLFVESNLRLVVAIVNTYNSAGLPVDDMVQEGILGLMRAVEKFDGRKGFKFSTYATWWIRQALQRGAQNYFSTLDLPLYVQDEWRIILRTLHDLEGDLKRHPSWQEVADATGYSVKKIQELQRAIEHLTSLDIAVLDDNSTVTLADAIGAEDPAIARAAEQDLMRQWLLRAMDRLPDKESKALRLSFGLDTGDSMSYGDIAELHPELGHPSSIGKLCRQGLERLNQIAVEENWDRGELLVAS